MWFSSNLQLLVMHLNAMAITNHIYIDEEGRSYQTIFGHSSKIDQEKIKSKTCQIVYGNKCTQFLIVSSHCAHAKSRLYVMHTVDVRRGHSDVCVIDLAFE